MKASSKRQKNYRYRKTLHQALLVLGEYVKTDPNLTIIEVYASIRVELTNLDLNKGETHD